jgi:hypothetical protein
MPRNNKIILLITFSIPGIIISLILAYFIQLLLIPDECYFHQNDANWFIKIMYDFKSSNGGHPFPSNFQFVLILGFGIYLSYHFCKRVLKI